MSDASPGSRHLMPQFPTLEKGREIPSPLCLQGPVPAPSTDPSRSGSKEAQEGTSQVVSMSVDIALVPCVTDSSGVAGASASQTTPARRCRAGLAFKGPELAQDIGSQ